MAQMYRPEYNKREDKASRFNIEGNLPVYIVLRMLSEQLRAFDIDLQVVLEQRAPYMGAANVGIPDNYLCLLRNNMSSYNAPKEEPEFEPIPEPDRELTYEERVEWFVRNYYETGMELQIMLDSLKGDDLDNFFWYNEKIEFPKMLSDLKKEENE